MGVDSLVLHPRVVLVEAEALVGRTIPNVIQDLVRMILKSPAQLVHLVGPKTHEALLQVRSFAQVLRFSFEDLCPDLDL